MHARRLFVRLATGAFLTLIAVNLPGLATGEDKPSPSATGKVTLQILDWKQTQALVASHKGKVVVLDAWSTSCDPCVREFPNLVKLHRDYGKDVACISMSCDYAGIKKKPPQFYHAPVLKFLEQQKATFDNVLSNVPSDELFEEMKLASIPAVYVYGRDGKLLKRFDNEQIKSDADEFTYKDVLKLVQETLSQK